MTDTDSVEGSESANPAEASDAGKMMSVLGGYNTEQLALVVEAAEYGAAADELRARMGALLVMAGEKLREMDGHRAGWLSRIVARLAAGEEHGELLLEAALAADKSHNVRPSRIETIRDEVDRLCAIAEGTPIITAQHRLGPRAYVATGGVRLDATATRFTVPVVDLPYRPDTSETATVGDQLSGSLAHLVTVNLEQQYSLMHDIYFGDRIGPALVEAVTRNMAASADWVLALAAHGLTLESVGISEYLAREIEVYIADRIGSFDNVTAPIAEVEAGFALDRREPAQVAQSMFDIIVLGLRAYLATPRISDSAAMLANHVRNLEDKVRAILRASRGVNPTTDEVVQFANNLRRGAGHVV